MALEVYCREAVTHGDWRSWEDFAGETGTVFAVKPQHESRAMSKKRGGSGHRPARKDFGKQEHVRACLVWETENRSPRLIAQQTRCHVSNGRQRAAV